ncbi:uncharacterized protein LOC133914670 [Phragmites australis]|uniref:uncharacterized protein LOC133914670 n=1 Tax=Phragmites australis TaxID=29695 RepID=UPI002D77CD40|nr:uncharacterized protein LOC133914670 [Phragmites australis]
MGGDSDTDEVEEEKEMGSNFDMTDDDEEEEEDEEMCDSNMTDEEEEEEDEEMASVGGYYDDDTIELRELDRERDKMKGKSEERFRRKKLARVQVDLTSYNEKTEEEQVYRVMAQSREEEEVRRRAALGVAGTCGSGAEVTVCGLLFDGDGAAEWEDDAAVVPVFQELVRLVEKLARVLV